MQVKVQPAALRSVEQAIHGRTMALESRHDGFRALKGRRPRVESYALERVLGDTDAEKSRVSRRLRSRCTLLVRYNTVVTQEFAANRSSAPTNGRELHTMRMS